MAQNTKKLQNEITKILKEAGEYQVAVRADVEAEPPVDVEVARKIDIIISKFFLARPKRVETEIKRLKNKHVIFKKIGREHAVYSQKLNIIGSVFTEAKVRTNKPSHIVVMMHIYDGGMREVGKINANGSIKDVTQQITKRIEKWVEDSAHTGSKYAPFTDVLEFYLGRISDSPPERKMMDRIRDIIKRPA